MKRAMLVLAFVALVGFGSLATSSTAEAGHCYRGQRAYYGGGYYAPHYGRYNSPRVGYQVYPHRVGYAPSYRAYYGPRYGGYYYGGRGGVSFSIGF